ncbi:flagellar basal body L-ring protein FlgH [Dyella acidiphila]|uniref:Flagellar basal body L-ring protein FlgH n=1 Tax=Dyella acidiphila TaxID=2775866 RepID=A0ABR9GF99_9GAMM|nr:flagellar basal body L-ring protein FlgH [Dyella acidiphila]MBE1162732.1 flagellar basal body L-ring protein FlgH [Dyella acidiphila]
MSTRFLLMAALLLASRGVSAQTQATDGSMINPDSYRGLAADRRAHQVGDTLTVLVTETARATASANTDASGGVQLGANAQYHNTTHNYGLGLNGDDAGQGNTTRAGSLQAQLAVRVIAVEGDGMLRIHGDQSVEINGEKQQFALTGLVRPEDISPTNTILSNRISEADIHYTGKGDISTAQRHSILYRITRWLGLI